MNEVLSLRSVELYDAGGSRRRASTLEHMRALWLWPLGCSAKVVPCPK